MKIKVAGIEKESFVDGPGIRYTIFAQGCKHKCKGCHNPSTHDFDKGFWMKVEEIYEDILKRRFIDGVTFTGGDPFFQAEAFSYLAKMLKKENYHIVAYTGFYFEELLKEESFMGLLKNVDVLVDGPFILEERDLKLKFRGSRNQRVIDVKKSLELNKVVTIEF
ncbi:anaerobic ribonucleoside-triphosphate reductase activating protein [Caloramator australicus]|uniref:Anaerobic ribonucleoside-triphosphate reductase-activating protein n=1 Tax=Caloramator australicus RC3 TaxID=857293 RepID=I7LKC0_9CLOT|nr:anaerobic ribonucleoside-triphosphate reductase activating protein [Caloramator australicus]CCJ34338.1 Ribonucleotide reductase of class III (anaerobic), activating protein [Caloramator australicus RC3]